jgi:hypothetical protein
MAGALMVEGEAGIGKTTLLAAAEELAGGFACLWARGVESEAALGHAALLELLTPVRDRLADLPGAQAEALAAALAGALRGGRAPDARNLSASQGNDRRRVVARWPQPRLGPSSWVAVAAYEPVILTNQALALAAVGLIGATSFQLPRGGPRPRRRGCR